MTITFVCKTCDRSHVATLSRGQVNRCPFCGCGVRRAGAARCEACGEPMIDPSPSGLCGFCIAEHEAAA